jgi:hypothetical protein
MNDRINFLKIFLLLGLCTLTACKEKSTEVFPTELILYLTPSVHIHFRIVLFWIFQQLAIAARILTGSSLIIKSNKIQYSLLFPIQQEACVIVCVFT